MLALASRVIPQMIARTMTLRAFSLLFPALFLSFPFSCLSMLPHFLGHRSVAFPLGRRSESRPVFNYPLSL